MPQEKQALMFEFLATLQRIHKSLGSETKGCYETGKLTKLQLEILSCLEENPHSPVGRLSKELGLSLSSLSQVIERLHDSELLVRERSDKDRRIVTLKLTKAGKRCTQDLRKKQRKAMQVLSEYFHTEDLKQMLTIHKRVLKNIEEKRKINT